MNEKTFYTENGYELIKCVCKNGHFRKKTTFKRNVPTITITNCYVCGKEYKENLI